MNGKRQKNNARFLCGRYRCIFDSDLIFLFLFNYLQSANEEKLQLQLRLQKEQADAAYYDALQKQLENQRVFVIPVSRFGH